MRDFLEFTVATAVATITGAYLVPTDTGDVLKIAAALASYHLIMVVFAIAEAIQDSRKK